MMHHVKSVKLQRDTHFELMRKYFTRVATHNSKSGKCILKKTVHGGHCPRQKYTFVLLSCLEIVNQILRRAIATPLHFLTLVNF